MFKSPFREKDKKWTKIHRERLQILAEHAKDASDMSERSKFLVATSYSNAASVLIA